MTPLVMHFVPFLGINPSTIRVYSRSGHAYRCSPTKPDQKHYKFSEYYYSKIKLTYTPIVNLCFVYYLKTTTSTFIPTITIMVTKERTEAFSDALQLLKNQIAHVWKTIAMALFCGIIFISFLVLLKYTTGSSFMALTRDPNALFQAPFYTGLSSMIGIIMWSFAASACLLTSWVSFSKGRHYGFMLFSGMFTLLLLLDDSFQFHEDLFPNYLNIPEKAVYVAYLMIFLTYVFLYYKEILKHEFVIWLTSLFFLFCSTLLDLVDDYFQARFLLEEGLKFLGILLWAIFFYRACRSSLNALFESYPSFSPPQKAETLTVDDL